MSRASRYSPRTRGALRLLALVLAALVAVMAAGCNRQGGARSAESGLKELRRVGPATSDARTAGRWLVAELVSPGGDARIAIDARKRLDEIGGGGMIAHFARGVDDSLHGRLRTAPDHYLHAVRAARDSDDPRAPFIAWFAADEALALRYNSPKIWQRWQRFVEESIRDPRHMGWRARGALVEWWADEAYDKATQDVEDLAAVKYGCAKNVRLAGPFGRSAPADVLRSFPAEAPGPWPYRWPAEPGIARAPKILKTTRHGCTTDADEFTGSGVFYGETFLELEKPQRILLAAQGALAVFVDDTRVLHRDSRKWGIWPDYGVLIDLAAGRHRVLARLASPSTNIRVMKPDGTPADVKTSSDAVAPYSIVPPKRVANPNLLMQYIRAGDVVDPGEDLTRFVASYLAHIEGQDDVASVMIEPLVRDPGKATGPALATAAVFAQGDPIFTATQTEDLVRELYQRATAKDPTLWAAQLHLILSEAKRKGPTEAVPRLRQMTTAFRDVPAVLSALASLYGELGWTPERDRAIEDLTKQFPDNIDAMYAAVDVYDRDGRYQDADKLVARILELDPDSEIVLTRALAQNDYRAALAELKRLGKRRPDRKDIAERVHDVMVRAGNRAETWKKLEAAIEKAPKDGSKRLALADARFASGKHAALRKALAEAVEAGAGTRSLTNAIDLVEGATELDPYRLDALDIIAEYEKSGVSLAGTAARVLDYMAVWVRSDGSSKLLEHEVIRIQSKEAIDKFAEHQRLPGMVLHMRVIKKDGRTLEPEYVAGKPTVTFPHLEVGDYIETEQIMSQVGDGRGLRYVGPHWFFREQNVAYARSEFIHVVPKGRNLVVETRGNVPKPQVEDLGHAILRRWRVDASPAAPVEPHSAPAQEFLPSVHMGWGVSLEHRIRRLADSVALVTPVDPRIKRIAKRIADPVPPSKKIARARKLYRWILANIEEGDETDGRRVVISKQGNRWKGFIELCRALGIPVEYAIARNRLASPPVGPLSEAGQFTDPVLRVGGAKNAVWLTVSSKFAPFGYVPAEIRGVDAYLLAGDAPKLIKTPAQGALDSVEYEGDIELAPDGSAKLQLVQRFHGKFAMGLRASFNQLPERQLLDVLESRLLGRALRGARLLDYDLEALDNPDVPLVIRMNAEMANFAQVSGASLILAPPFTPRISQLATLAARQTPLLISEASHQVVRLKIKLPPGARLETEVGSRKVEHDEFTVTIADRLGGNLLELDRVLDLPAGRIQPAEYPGFVKFAREADDAMSRSVRIRVR